MYVVDVETLGFDQIYLPGTEIYESVEFCTTNLLLGDTSIPDVDGPTIAPAADQTFSLPNVKEFSCSTTKAVFHNDLDGSLDSYTVSTGDPFVTGVTSEATLNNVKYTAWSEDETYVYAISWEDAANEGIGVYNPAAFSKLGYDNTFDIVYHGLQKTGDLSAKYFYASGDDSKFYVVDISTIATPSKYEYDISDITPVNGPIKFFAEKNNVYFGIEGTSQVGVFQVGDLRVSGTPAIPGDCGDGGTMTVNFANNDGTTGVSHAVYVKCPPQVSGTFLDQNCPVVGPYSLDIDPSLAAWQIDKYCQAAATTPTLEATTLPGWASEGTVGDVITISGTPDKANVCGDTSFDVTYRLTDTCGYGEDTFTITYTGLEVSLNVAVVDVTKTDGKVTGLDSTITGASHFSAFCDFALSITSGIQGWMTATPSGDDITITATAANIVCGTYPLTVQALETNGNTNTDDFDVIITGNVVSTATFTDEDLEFGVVYTYTIVTADYFSSQCDLDLTLTIESGLPSSFMTQTVVGDDIKIDYDGSDGNCEVADFYDIVVRATDTSAKYAELTLRINVNKEIVVTSGIPDQDLTFGTAFDYTVVRDTHFDSRCGDPIALSLQSTLPSFITGAANGDDYDLSYDGTTVTCPAEDYEDITIRGADSFAFAEDTFRVYFDKNPVVVTGLEDQEAFVGEEFSVTIDDDEFASLCSGETAEIILIGQIPDWMEVTDVAGGVTYSGTPTEEGVYEVELVAQDSFGSVNATFDVVVEESMTDFPNAAGYLKIGLVAMFTVFFLF